MGKKKEQTVGYKYFLGMHVVVSEGPIDAITELGFADRTFWSGVKRAGQIRVSRPSLFGGQAREGGVGGFIDILSGDSDQPVNGYLQSRLGGLVPAFRGVCSLVFRKFYIGNNPYMQPLRIKAQSVQRTFGAWLPDLAPIGAELSIDKVAIYIAIDQSGSMAFGTRQATMQAAVNEVISILPETPGVAVRLQTWDADAGSGIERFGITAADKAAFTSFINSLPTPFGGTNFDAAVANAAAFFGLADAVIDTGNAWYSGAVRALAGGASGYGESQTNDPIRRVFIFITDGEPNDPATATSAAATLAGIDGIETFGVNIVLEDTQYTAIVDAVGGDGVVPVISEGNSDALAEAIAAGFSSFVDLNGVHILRDILINPAHGGSGDESMIGDSFAVAAQQAYNEGLGFSFRWRNRGDVDSFKQLVERHLDAVTYFDAVTGKYEIKLIRPDYVVEDLVIFGAAGVPVVEWFEPEQPDPGELPNQVVVTYTRRDNGEPGAVTATNVAAVVSSGRIVTHKVSYEGVTRPVIAAKLAERDLLVKSQPIVKGGFRAAYLPASLNLGSVIVVNEPRLGLDSLVVRITEIEEADGTDNSVVVRFVEDAFGLDLELEPVIGAEDLPSENDRALPPNVVFAEELPYFELVRLLGQTDVDNDLAADEGYGVWGAAADQPNGRHITGQLLRYDYPVWLEVGSSSLMPSWSLLAALPADASVTTFTASENEREAEVAVGDIIQVGGEMMRVDAVSVDAGVTTFTVGRGILDTVPARHALGARAFIWQGFTGTDNVEYTAGEEVQVAVLPRTSREAAALGDVPQPTITFASRAARPYPVGRFQIEGAYTVSGAQAGDLEATWAHRDRTFQTQLAFDDHTAASIGPEAGVAYLAVTREVFARSDVFAGSDFFAAQDLFLDEVRGPETVDAISPAQSLSWTFNVDEPSPAWGEDVMRLELGVRTVRGVSAELESWQVPFIMVQPLLSVVGLSAETDFLGGGGSGSGSGSGASP